MGAMPPSGKKRKTSAKPSLKLVAKPADAKPPEAAARIQIPRGQDNVQVRVAPERVVRLTNLGKLFWPAEGITKGDLHPVLRRRRAECCCRTCATARW